MKNHDNNFALPIELCQQQQLSGNFEARIFPFQGQQFFENNLNIYFFFIMLNVQSCPMIDDSPCALHSGP